jgi:hypothetical protein
MAKKLVDDPTFNRSEVALVLDVSVLTVANREKNGKYPRPKRDLNNYRYYTLNDLFNLQLKTFNHIDTKPIISVMYDKGYGSFKNVSQIIDQALSKRGINAR